jgi:simple sugar transport system substrate-binding protein
MIGRSWSRRLVAAVVTTTLAISALGAGAVAQDEKPVIYVVAPSLSDPFWITQQNGANQAGEDFGVEVNFQAPAADTGDAGMVPLLQAAIAANPAGIAIDYTSKTMEAVTTEALDAGIPVVLYNNNRFEGENAPDDARILDLAFVGQDESVSGEILVNSWLPNLPAESCNVLLVNPFPTAFVLTLRGEGAARALEAAGYTHETLVATADEGQNLSLISAKLQEDPSICGIVGLGGPASNPASQYVIQNDLDIPIATFDVGGATAEWIRQGGTTMAINQQPFLQSYFSVANLANQALYDLSPANVDTGTSIVTLDNIDIVQACLDAGRC